MSSIPDNWGKGLTVLICKKGATDDPANFHPITLQPVLYKIFSSVIRLRLYSYLNINGFINKNIQKGFWGKVNRVCEHTQMLTHIMNEAKRHQRGLIVTLLDLRNAFGEVQHKLMQSSLKLHHVPDSISSLIMNIYSHATIQVTTPSGSTIPIRVERGVLQGDPCFPLLFNICFNSLMKVIEKQKYQQLGYIWGAENNLTSRAWMQFADDAPIIAKDPEGMQTPINVAVAWCKWAEMLLRIDKCLTYGMHKTSGTYIQFKPTQFINHTLIPAVEINSSLNIWENTFYLE